MKLEDVTRSSPALDRAAADACAAAPASSPASASRPGLPRCRPRVRLFADRIVVARTAELSSATDEALVPLIALSFDYGGTRIAAGDERERILWAGGPGVLVIERDRRAEGEARRAIEALGAVELACFDAVAAPADCDAEYVVRADGDSQAFCAFTARALARWRDLRWDVEVDDAYPFRVVDSRVPWFARIEPCEDRPDWFGLELGVEIDGVRVDLLAAILDLVDRVDRDGGLAGLTAAAGPAWALRVSETHHVPVPVDRLRALVRAVAEIYQGGPRERRVFPAVRAGALGALDAAFEKDGGGGICWRDPSGAVSRGRARTAPPKRAAPPKGLRASLRPYQAEGVAFLQRLREQGGGGVLADDMGLGKTLQTIAHLALEQEAGRLDAPALVVAPTSLVGNWSRELARFAPALRVVVLHGAERHARWADAASAHVIVTTYPILVRDERRFAELRFRAAILDEAQAIKNARSQARRALASISAGHRICLTGTPVENHLGELWSLFDWLAPGLLGDELSFRRFFRQPIETQGAEERLGALRDLVAPFVLRRLKRDVARELPPKTELFAPVELGPAQRELYEAIRVAAHADVRRAIRAKGFAGAAVTILDALTKLRQVCCDPRLVALDAARPVRESAKLDCLVALLRRELASDHRILVFSQFVSMLTIIAETLSAAGIRHVSLTGETRQRQR
ncbi:MAG: DEAD/DEAH box helicase family protein, partial [Myxococcales bacterium]|nr:DEAD/DEAH box helicase family protein [Myxococcales bacterium]